MPLLLSSPIRSALAGLLLAVLFACSPGYDVLITDGLIYDGNGGAPFVADIGISGDRIVAIGDLGGNAELTIDANGFAVAPGFINMLSWANESLLIDGRSQGDIRQGVTLEVFGEGRSDGPLNEAMQAEIDPRWAGEWTTLGEYLEFMVEKGVSPNVASFVGEYGGMYISHLRSEGNRLLESLEELIHIAREADMPAEVYHLKMAGQENWDKFDDVVAMVEAARAEGLRITADIYTYTAGSTGLDAGMPPWVQEGGYAAWAERLQDPDIRAQVLTEMTTPTNDWENLMLAAGAEGALLVGFENPDLRRYAGMTLGEVAAERETSPAETAIDLVIEDGSRVQVVYFLMSEENVAKGIALPWVSFASDAASMATEGEFLDRMTHPRAYGNFARVLGKYVRDEQVITLEDAVRKLTKLPATNLGIRDRGELREGFHADIAIFDPDQVQDHATFDDPHQYSTGMVHVLVNGVPVLSDGEHTGALPGQVVRGPGWTGWD